jgi:hypothetical protein
VRALVTLVSPKSSGISFSAFMLGVITVATSGPVSRSVRAASFSVARLAFASLTIVFATALSSAKASV